MHRRLLITLLSVLTLLVAGTAPASAHPRLLRAHDRVVAYYQTIYTTDDAGVKHYVDPRPLTRAVTDVNVGAIHLNDDRSLHLNDDPPSDPSFRRMWRDLHAMQRHGVTVNAFVGGAAQGSYRNLAEHFDVYYPILRDFLRTYRLNGVDLDIEESFSLDDTVKLVRALRHDFGPRFVITLTPVASDLAGLTDFSGGFSYAELERRAGRDINWYNAQFYCGWGDLRTTDMYAKVLANGFAPDRFVAGTVTNPANCSGYVDPATLRSVLHTLTREHHDFGGVAGWEYVNALGVRHGEPSSPADWYAAVRRDLTRTP